MKPPRIAILMPAYNPGPEIEGTLDSLRRQSMPFTLVLVDDGSARKPDYRKLLEGIDHHLIELPRNVGVNEVRNPGLEYILASNFDLICLIDCGDRAKPDRLEVQTQYLLAHPNTAILGSWVEMIYEDGGRYVVEFPSGAEKIRRAMFSNMPVCHPALMIRPDVFRRIGRYSNEFEAAEDYDMVLRAAVAGFGIDNVQAVLLEKYETRNSVSWKKRKAQLASRLALQWRYRDLSEPTCIKGLVKTGLLRATPDRAVRQIKTLLGRQA
ncbi:MAG: glycosyltransferase [Aestuariivirga sp.]